MCQGVGVCVARVCVVCALPVCVSEFYLFVCECVCACE